MKTYTLLFVLLVLALVSTAQTTVSTKDEAFSFIFPNGYNPLPEDDPEAKSASRFLNFVTRKPITFVTVMVQYKELGKTGARCDGRYLSAKRRFENDLTRAELYLFSTTTIAKTDIEVFVSTVPIDPEELNYEDADKKPGPWLLTSIAWCSKGKLYDIALLYPNSNIKAFEKLLKKILKSIQQN